MIRGAESGEEDDVDLVLVNTCRVWSDGAVSLAGLAGAVTAD